MTDPLGILVVEDEPAVRQSLCRALTDEGYAVTEASDGATALQLLRAAHVDAVILDVMLPGLDGLKICRRLRASGSRTPVLMLTALDEIDARVAGLDAGADDYLAKPFALRELLARLRALVRRANANGSPALLTFDDLTLDTVAVQAFRGPRQLTLTRTEYLLLETFLRHPRQVLSHAQLFEQVWGHDLSDSSNTLNVYISYLRRKTEAAGEPRLLHTVRGVGYTLRAAQPPRTDPAPSDA